MNSETTRALEMEAALEQIEPKIERKGLSDKERVERAKNAFLRKLDGRKAVDLDTCIHCGMCAEACPFYLTMIEDGMKALGREEDIKVLDIAELVERSLG